MLCDEACRARFARFVVFVIPEEAGGIIFGGAAAAAEAGATSFGLFALIPPRRDFVAAGVLDEGISTHDVLLMEWLAWSLLVMFLRCRVFRKFW